MNKENFNDKDIKRILITGISGSGGSYLAEYILKLNIKSKIYGVSRWHSTSNNNNLEHIINDIELIECDLNDLSSTLKTLKIVKPNLIFHLASQANVKTSFNYPSAILNNNIQSTLNLLESVKILKLKPIIQICSTSEVYGQVTKEEVPIKETNQYRPASPYAISKLAQDLLGNVYSKSYGLNIITTRMFSYLNPRRTDLFATSFAMQIAKIEHGLSNSVLHGNLKSTRTIIDVEDAMKAYWLALKYGKFGENYNIGGNKVIEVGEFLKQLIRLSNKKIITKIDKNLLRPNDVTLQIPDTSKFKKATGFEPSIPFDKSMINLLNFWRDRVKSGKF